MTPKERFHKIKETLDNAERDLARLNNRYDEIKNKVVAPTAIKLKQRILERYKLERFELINIIDRLKTELWGLEQDAIEQGFYQED